MERSKQIQFGLLGALALLLVANMFGGGFKGLFKTEGEQIRESAAMVNTSTSSESGNIPGTNTTAPAAPQPTGPTTTIKYDNDRYNFGVCNEGDVMKHSFKFTNTGSEPLIVSNCKGSCGCTVPTWPKEPIPPGGTGEIKVEFNSKGKPGPQSKKVTVTANTNPTETFLEISGEVKGKEQPAAKSGK